METRGKKVALSEDELEAVRLAQVQRDKQLREEAAALEKEKSQFAREKRDFEINKNAGSSADSELRGLITGLKDTFMRELSNIRQEIEIRRSATRSPTPPARQRFRSAIPSPPRSPERQGGPKISFREILEGVPRFDGYNIPLTQFARACRRARESAPANHEKYLTRLLINRLSDRAYAAVEDEPCETVMQLIDLLNNAFGASHSIDQYRGELSKAYMRANEHILDFISRVKELRSAILDAERRARGNLDYSIISEVDQLTARSFCDGLPVRYRVFMRERHENEPFEVFAAAKAIAKRDELEKERYDPNYRTGQRGGMRPFPGSVPTRDYRDFRSTGDRQRPPIGYSAPRDSREFYNERRDPRESYNTGRDSREFYNIRRDPRNYRNDRREHYPERHDIRENGDRRHVTNTTHQYPADAAQNMNSIWCRYCKNPGHEIQNCRKREYNRNNQGNPAGPSSRDATRAGPPTSRSVRCIKAETEEEEKRESGSSE